MGRGGGGRGGGGGVVQMWHNSFSNFVFKITHKQVFLFPPLPSCYFLPSPQFTCNQKSKKCSTYVEKLTEILTKNWQSKGGTKFKLVWVTMDNKTFKLTVYLKGIMKNWKTWVMSTLIWKQITQHHTRMLVLSCTAFQHWSADQYLSSLGMITLKCKDFTQKLNKCWTACTAW